MLPDTRERRPAAVLIAGPTTSGKSALALALAQEFRGTVVNADSMQVYADLRRLSARPTPEDEALTPHRLYGHADGAMNFSAAHFQRDASAVLAETASKSRLPIFVGGTGLYFKVLDQGFSELPEVPDAVRAAVRAEAEGRSTGALHAELDPLAAAVLRPSDRLRVMRALEVFRASGRSIVAFQGQRRPGPLAGRPLLKLFLDVDRDTLRSRIDARFVTMMRDGALDEVAALRERRLEPMLPVMRAHGVPGLIAYLEGAISLEDAIRRGQADTRRYAKRQFTWFRHQMGGDWIWTGPEAALTLARERLSAPAGR